ncbi:aldo/keto reductase [Marinivivus vitaminiproducens]|uniref:aldo/keto reductase n=1 Tax=Marinivivus vitaminiproducens TaxID=3035935 RepID=UPI0027A89EB8|nr:aldo/keto reductase [Geminicoccaceae bacterium SCSIO 64248]
MSSRFELSARRTLGKSGVAVSPLCLGTMMFGDQTERADAARIVDSAKDAGVNFIDTADAYAKGESERIVGELIKANREHWVLATKVGNATEDGPGGLKPEWLAGAIDKSLARLALEHVDIWYLHRPDRDVPLEDTIGAVGRIVEAGKIRAWGFSNYRGWQVGELVRVADSLGVPRPVVCQPYYNAVNRMPENDILPACLHYGIGVVPYSPLARGVLTGKYAPDEAPSGESRAGRNDRRMMETEWRRESLVVAREIVEHVAFRNGMTAADFALLWVLNNRIVTSVLAGPRTQEHWQAYLGALEHEFDAEDEALIDRLVASGHPSTPGYNDPRYPIEGRMVG